MNGRHFFPVLASTLLLLAVVRLASGTDWFGDPINSPLPGAPTTASVGNLDGQPGLDVAVGSGFAEIWILSSNVAGEFTQVSTLSSPGAASYIGVGDVNADGSDDVVAANVSSGPGLRVFLGSGDGTFDESETAESELGVHLLRVADLDADGHDDVVTACDGRTDIHWGTAVGLIAQPTSLSIDLGACNPPTYREALIVDTDGDPYLDIVLVARARQSSCGLPNLNGIARFRGQANRQFGAVEWLVVEEYDDEWYRWESAAAGDIDGDQDLDFVISPQLSALRVFVKEGPGSWVPGAVVDGANLGLSVSPLFDLDQNGTLDLAGSGRRVVSGSGDGEFQLVDTTGVTGTILGLEEVDALPGVDLVGLNRTHSLLHVLPNLVYQDPAAIEGATSTPTGGSVLTASPSVWFGHGPIRVELWARDGGGPEARPGSTAISVFDLQGRMVAHVAPEGAVAPGSEGLQGLWMWDPPTGVPAGVYWLQAPGVPQPARVVLLR